MKTRFARRAGAFALMIPGLSLADGLQLTTGSVITSGMTRSAPISAIRSALEIAAGGSATAILQCDGQWIGLGSDGVGLIRNMPTNASAIALGNAHGIAIVQDPQQGMVIQTWGAEAGFVTHADTAIRIPSHPQSGLAWEGIAAGGSHSAAWSTDGTLFMAGMNDHSQCTPPIGSWESVALGGSHSVGIDRITRRVLCWGLGSSNQTQVPADLGQAVAVAAGLLHTAAIDSKGTLRGWGSNANGQRAFPGASSSVKWIDVKAGALHTVALRNDGLAQAWGDNTYGQCNIGGPTLRSKSGVDSIATGLYHTALLASSDACRTIETRLSVVGANFYGEAGTPSEPIVDMACGDGFTVGLRQDRTVVVWGSRSDGIQNSPKGVFAQVAAGPRHAGAITIDGYLYMWGSPSDYRTTPPEILKTERWTRLACGTKHSIGLLNTGGVRAWGSNSAGQTSVPAGLIARAVAAGPYFSAAVATSGAPVIWGSNPTGELTPPPGLLVQEIAAGARHCLVLRQDGAVIGWGNNEHAQSDVPAGIGKALAVSAAESVSAALLADGTVRAWGEFEDLDNQWRAAESPAVPTTMIDGRPLRAHRVSVGGGSVATLVGHKYVADFTKGPYWTIQDAIDAAPVGAEVEVASGRWKPEQIRADRTGLVLRGDIVLTAQNPSPSSKSDTTATILEGTTGAGGVNRLSRSIVTVWNNESPACVIRGFVFYMGQRGQVWPENPVQVVGGAIYVGQNSRAEFCEGARFVGASPTIENCFFDRCYAGFGGGIYLSRSRATIQNCVFEDCEAQTSGGAIYGWAFNGLIQGCVFTGNQAIDKDGGAVGFVTVSDSFQWCSANCNIDRPERVPCDQVAPECGTRYDRGAPVLRYCSFASNKAHAYGGAIAYTLQYRHPDAIGANGARLRNMQCYDCTFSLNSSANGGGGICIAKPDLITNTTAACPYADPSGIELRGCRGTDNIASIPGAARYADLMGDWVDLGNNNFRKVGSPCPFDIDSDDTIDYGDLAIVMMLLGTDSFADFDSSGIVDFGDINILLLEFGPCR